MSGAEQVSALHAREAALLRGSQQISDFQAVWRDEKRVIVGPTTNIAGICAQLARSQNQQDAGFR